MLSDFIIDLNDFRILGILGKGSFAIVYKIENIKTNEIYAAKVILQKIINQTDREKFNAEVEALIRVQSTLTVNFIGFNYKNFSNEDFPTIIVSYMPNGSLDNLMFKQRNSDNKYLNDTKKYILLLGIALGMQVLHSRNLVHRDLKPDNILINEKFYPLISDFGTSKFLQGSILQNYMESEVGTIFYQAPEILRHQKYDFKVDIYSYSLIAYELITGKKPNFGNSIVDVIKNIIDHNCSDFSKINEDEQIKIFLEKCWSNDPNDRPSFDEIVETLCDIQFCSKFKINFQEMIDYLDLFPENQIVCNFRSQLIKLRNENMSTENSDNHTKLTENSDNHTKSTENSDNHTKSTESLESHTKSTENSDNHTKSTENSDNHTKSTENSDSHTKLTENSDNHTKSTENSDNHTKSTENSDNHTKLTENSDNHTKSTENSDNNKKVSINLPPDKIFNIALIGSTFSGKSSLLKTFITGNIYDFSNQTRDIGFNFSSKIIHTRYGDVKFKIFDYSAHFVEKIRSSIGKLLHNSNDAIIITVGVRDSFERQTLNFYIRTAIDHCEGNPIYVAATHCHLDWVFPEEELKHVCDDHNYKLFKTSIYDIESINSMFDTIANDVIERYIIKNNTETKTADDDIKNNIETKTTDDDIKKSCSIY